MTSLHTIDDPFQLPEPDFPPPYTADQRVMLLVHPWVLLCTYLVLTFGGLYGGVIHPLLCSLWSYCEKGFVHKSRWFTIVMCALMGWIGLGILVTFYIKAQPSPQCDKLCAFWNDVWLYLDYWNWNERLIMPGYLFWYIYGAFALNLVLCSVFALVARWDPTPTLVQQCSQRHAFIIVTHNSSNKLTKPVQAILQFAQPHQIFIADNGSTEEEQVKTRALCRSLSTDSSQIRVAHLSYGNKTLAQYACVKELVRRYNAHTSPIDIVTMIDDDVCIPATFPADSVERQLLDPSIIAIAYPLSCDNADASTYATLQDVEYFTGNVARYVQWLLGSQLFASGAAATWKIHPLIKVLERHCTAFNGEDLEMGCETHLCCDSQTNKLGVEGFVRLGFEPNCVIPTTVPVCVWHWYDFIPNALRRRWRVQSCSCGEASFFNQRLRSWDPACHAYFVTFVKIIFSSRGTRYGPNLFIRVLCLWKIISLLREYLLVFGIVFSFTRVGTVQQLIDLCIFYVDSICVSWACGVLTGWTQSMSVARQGFALRPDIVVTYPLLLELPYGLIIRPISCLYSYIYYVWGERAPAPLRKQMERDPEKAQALLETWVHVP